MSKSNTTLYLGVAAAGGLGYYLYRSGGSPKGAKEELKKDANKAREKIPRGTDAEKVGEEYGKEAGAQIDEAINNARTKVKADERIPEITEEATKRIDQIRQDAADKVGKFDRKVEEKASEAKGTVSGWFGGGNK